MKLFLTIKNYRCFVSPATIEFGRGFTAFVGVNNAGKSALMRFLLEFRPLFNAAGNAKHFNASLSAPRQIGHPLLHVLDQSEVFSNLNRQPILFTVESVREDNDEFNIEPSKVEITVGRDLHWASTIWANEKRVQPENIIERDGKVVLGGKIKADVRYFFSTMEILTKTLYVGPFRNTINIGSKDDYLDIQVGGAFIKQFRALKTGPNKKSNEDISRLTEEIRNIFRFSALDIAPSADDQSLHLTVNNKPYKQHEVGSGLLQFVMVLANTTLKMPKLVLIDEPELNLHPALQLSFLISIGKHAETGVWFSTHSIGLARAGAERIYSVTIEKDGDSRVRALLGTRRLGELLGEMSFSSHKELGFEKIVLVEGPTDLKAIQEFLRKISKDHLVLPLPLHGHMPKADELEEILRITTNVSALIDSERSADGVPLRQDRMEFLNLCSAKGLVGHALDRRAMENYFTDAAIKETFGGSYRSLSHFEKLEDANPHWSKSDNWRLAAAMKFDDLRGTDLGSFLEAL